MATTEFTLEDIRQVVREESDASFDRKFGSAFIDAFEPFAGAIQQDLNQINDRFDHLETKVEAIAHDVGELKADMKGLKRIVGQHSREIIELRSRIA